MSFRRGWRPSAGRVFYWAYQDAKREARRDARRPQRAPAESDPYAGFIATVTGIIFFFGALAGFNGNYVFWWSAFWVLFAPWAVVFAVAMKDAKRLEGLPLFWNKLLFSYFITGLFTIGPFSILVGIYALANLH